MRKTADVDAMHNDSAPLLTFDLVHGREHDPFAIGNTGRVQRRFEPNSEVVGIFVQLGEG